MGSCGNENSPARSWWTEIRRSQRFGSEQAAHGVVRLGNEERPEAGVLEEARGLLRCGSRCRGLEVRGQFGGYCEREADPLSGFEWTCGGPVSVRGAPGQACGRGKRRSLDLRSARHA